MAAPSSFTSSAPPEQGQLAEVRQRRYIVNDVRRSTLPAPVGAIAKPQHLVSLTSIDDDGLGEELQVIWELEPGAKVHDKMNLPEPAGFDAPARLDAFLDAVRWGASSMADTALIQSPFRAGIEFEPYQLDPVVRAVEMPRVNLLNADDVGLGKTIETGLVLLELILRHRARRILVVVPASLQIKWQGEMRDKFGLEFRIVDSRLMHDLRRSRGLHANPWKHFPRLITSIDFIKRERPLRLFREVLPAAGESPYPRRFDVLVVDEAHNVAPSGRGQYALDSLRTAAMRTLAPHFEHKLFLTATPHNGYPESFTALLELLDPQRFERGVPPNPQQLQVVMVRRLKSEITDWDGRKRFPERKAPEPLIVAYTDQEKAIHTALQRYAALRLSNAHDFASQCATEFVLKLLKKRLFSSPRAFADTLARHEESLRGTRRQGQSLRPTTQFLQREFERVDEDHENDEELETATAEALQAAAQVVPDVGKEERDLLAEMREWARDASTRPDSKARTFMEWLADVVRPAEEANPGISILPEGEPATGNPAELPLPKDAEERRVFARRLIAQRCLYGVDKNPQAVEMAKLSLWLLTLDKDRPFTFLDHATKCGDSLLGVTSRLQVEAFHFQDTGESQPKLWRSVPATVFGIATDRRRRLEATPVMIPGDAKRKELLLRQADEATEVLRLLSDLLVGAAIATANGRPPAENGDFERRRAGLWRSFQDTYRWDESVDSAGGALESLRPEAARMLDTGLPAGLPSRRPFHWPIEFPEVLVDAEGFDAVIGNPPFMGGKKITGALGTAYRDHLVGTVAAGQRGSADICAYFFLRGWGLLNRRGQCALLATNTIAQGDTREVGLDRLTAEGAVIPRAVSSRKWPGHANLEVAEVWLRKGEWAGPFVLDEKPVAGITAQLTPPGEVEGKPFRLRANEGKSFQGSIVLGLGFTMTPEEAEELKRKDPRNAEVLFPYLNGEDLNSRPDQSPSRCVINFHDWPLKREIPRRWADVPDGERKEMLRVGVVTLDYPHPVAADYPDCLAIVEEKVKPERTRKEDDGSFALRYPLYMKWWIYADKRPELYTTIAGMERVLVLSLVNNHIGFARVPADQVFAHRLAVFTVATWRDFAVLQSHVHYHWAWDRSSTLRRDLNYSPSDCVETFPFPPSLDSLEDIGRRYYEHRQAIIQATGKGLTTTYNRFHDRYDQAEDIEQLRRLNVEMDQAVARAYGWDDLDLGHGFHQTRQGERFTISDPGRRAVLDRLLKLNHERHAAEVAAGLFEDRRPRGPRGRQARDTTAGSLFSP